MTIWKAATLAVIVTAAATGCSLGQSPLTEELAKTGTVNVIHKGNPTVVTTGGKITGMVATYDGKLVACDFPEGASRAAVINNWQQPVETAAARPGIGFVQWPGVDDAKCLAKEHDKA